MATENAGRANNIAESTRDELGVGRAEQAAPAEAVLRDAHLTPFPTMGSGGIYANPPTASRLNVAPSPNTLTARERETLRHVVLGRKSSEIAAMLGIRPRTVDAHRANISRKLGIRRVADLVRYAIRERIIEAE